jgi:hypothetical protein
MYDFIFLISRRLDEMTVYGCKIVFLNNCTVPVPYPIVLLYYSNLQREFVIYGENHAPEL